MAAATGAPRLEKVSVRDEGATTSYGVAKLDQQWSLGLNKRFSHAIPRQLYMLLEHSGNGVLWLLLAPAVWLFAPLSATSRLKVANFFLGLWVDLALVGALKGIFKRPRPEYNISADFILVVAVDRYSFPSGHAARVSYVAAFAMVCLAQWSLLFSLIVCGWAVTTALSRALMGRHYLGDVVTGLLLGIVTTAIVTKGSFVSSLGWLPEDWMESLHAETRAKIKWV